MEGAQSRPGGVSRPGAAAIVLAGGGLVAAAVFFGGGSGDGSVFWIGGAAVALAALALGAVALGRWPAPALDRPSLLAIGALAALVAWAGVSIAWSVAGDLSWAVLNKGIAYTAFLVVGLAFVALGRNTTRVLASLLAVVFGGALTWALLGKAIPALAAHDAVRVARLHSPVGYWNALALLADASLALAAWLAVAAWERRPSVRACGAALAFLAVLSGLLTVSRAGIVGGALALGLWLWLGARRVESAAVVVVAGVPAAAIAGWAFTRSALVDSGQQHSARVHDGAIFGALTIAGLVVAVVGVLVVVPWLTRGRERLVGWVLVAGAVVAVLAGLAIAVVAVGNPVTSAAHGFSRGECTNTAEHLVCTNNNRLRWWREAGHVIAAHPLGGAGAGTFEVARKRYRTSGDTVAEPHSLPLQVLAGTGLVGGILLAVFVGGTAVGVQRRLAGPDDPERMAAVAVTALPLAYSLHALVDYDLDFVAVTAPTLFVVGALLGSGRPLVRARPAPVAAFATAAVAVAAIASLALPWLAGRRVDSAWTALDTGRLAQAADDARSARSLNPLSPEPLYALASAYVAADDLTTARAEYRRATRLQPENPATWYELGLFEYLHTQDLCAAYQALNHAYTLDPRSTLWYKGSELDQARAAVDNGACER